MDFFETPAAYLEMPAERFAHELRRAADRAKEKHIRIAVERRLEVIGRDLDVRIEGKHEARGETGRHGQVGC